MSRQAYLDSQRLSSEESFEALIMALLRKADDQLFRTLDLLHPSIARELRERYNAPGGLLEGEQK